MCVLMFESSHRPDGKNADALALILACTTVTDASMNYSTYVPQRPRKFPSPRWENSLCACLDSCLHNCGRRSGQLQYVRAAETFKTSHSPDGIFTWFALVLAGRRCAHRQWHGDLLIVHHHWQHSWRQLCACSCSKVPIASMVKILTRLL